MLHNKNKKNLYKDFLWALVRLEVSDLVSRPTLIFKYVVSEPGLDAVSKNGIKLMTLSTDKVQSGVPLLF